MCYRGDRSEGALWLELIRRDLLVALNLELENKIEKLCECLFNKYLFC